MNVAASVRKHKEAHPEKYCPDKRCLWRTGGQFCPKHHQHERYLGDARDYQCDTCTSEEEVTS